MSETIEQRIIRLTDRVSSEKTTMEDVERFAATFVEEYELPRDRVLAAMDAFVSSLAGEAPLWADKLAERLQSKAKNAHGSIHADGYGDALRFAAGAIIGAAMKGGAQ